MREKKNEKSGANENYTKKLYKESMQILDNRLDWEKHIDKERAKNTIKVVVGKKWRGDRKTLKYVQCNI